MLCRLDVNSVNNHFKEESLAFKTNVCFTLLTEQHFLTQLQDVGILSLTPARMVLGARIAAHDDRYERWELNPFKRYTMTVIPHD